MGQKRKCEKCPCTNLTSTEAISVNKPSKPLKYIHNYIFQIRRERQLSEAEAPTEVEDSLHPRTAPNNASRSDWLSIFPLQVNF